jgi:hypothetical protein
VLGDDVHDPPMIHIGQVLSSRKDEPNGTMLGARLFTW